MVRLLSDLKRMLFQTCTAELIHVGNEIITHLLVHDISLLQTKQDPSEIHNLSASIYSFICI